MAALPISQYGAAQTAQDGRVIYLFPQQAQPNNEPKLKKDGTVKIISKNKKKGKKSEVYPLETEDIKKILVYFKDNEKWLPYLIFVLSCNMARRVGDTMRLTWEHIYNPATGNMRADLLEFEEDKTDKLANPHINSACRAAIQLYIEKTGCDPTKDGYAVPICMQLSGTYEGRVMSESGYYKALKKAAYAVGITYNVGTHSPRKTFGMMNRKLHPNDYDSMEILQSIYNHSDTKTTKHYIGLTKQKIDAYYDDMGKFFDDYITGDKEPDFMVSTPVISLDSNDLRDLIKTAYEVGRENANSSDAMTQVDAITDIMLMAEKLKK